MELIGPATGQVVYSWEKRDTSSEAGTVNGSSSLSTIPAVLFLVKQNDKELTTVAANTISELITRGIQVLIDDSLKEQLDQLNSTNLDFHLDSHMIRLFKPKVS